MAVGDIKVYTISYQGLELQINAIDLGGGQTSLEIKCLEGYADVNAVYWHDGVDDGSSFAFTEKKDNSLNMNGTGEDWDGGQKLSATGLGKDGTSKSTYLTAGESYWVTVAADFDLLETLGVRATSTSTSEGSIKGVASDYEEISAPSFSVSDVEVTEGTDPTADVDITLSHAYPYDITVNYTTNDGDATQPGDYTTNTGSVTFLAGETSKTVSVGIVDDDTHEETETFKLELTGASADIGVLGDNSDDLALATGGAEGTVTILDDDEEEPVAPTVAQPYTGTGDPNDFDSATATASTTNWSETSGNDTKVGDGGDNTIYGGDGNDNLYGGGGDDTLYGGNNVDNIYGQAGNDTIYGGANNDFIYGGSGNDIIYGDANTDMIYGGSGADSIDGGAGNDQIYGGYGADSINLSSGGNDTVYYLSILDTGDEITGFGTGDVLNFAGIDAVPGGGDNPFGSITQSNTPVANSLVYFVDGADTKVWADTDGDTSTVELEITLLGFTGTLDGSNVVL